MGESREGGELRTDKVGTGCDMLYATFVHGYEVQKPWWGGRGRGGKMRGQGGARKCEGERCERCEGCERHSECLGTHKYRYHLSNEALALNGLGRHRKMQEKKYLMVRKICFLIVISKKVKARSIF